jgi:hypothetical protein
MRADWWEVPGRDEAWKQEQIMDLGSEEDFNQEYGNQFIAGNTLLFQSGILRKIKGYFWLCKCDCGTEKEININNLKSKETVSCGCHRKVNSFKGFGNLSATHWNHIKTQAEQRGFEFNITIEYAWNLFLKQKERCSMSGIKIYISRNIANKKLQKTASLDRIDSKKGYIEGNVQWIHKTINKMKNNILEEDFINFCRIICNHRESEIDLDFP